MKRVFLLPLIVITVMVSLSGCAGVNERLEEQMIRKSGVLEDSSYIAYKTYESEGKLDEEGYYAEADESSAVTEEQSTAHGTIHVTFSDNNNLHIQYYSDAAHQLAVDQSACYLNSGDALYAEVKVSDDAFSSMYYFAGFRIMENDDNGGMTESASVKIDGSGTEYVISIPQDFKGTELSVVPIGAYQKRVISLTDYCTDDNGSKKELNGTWIINDREYTDNAAEISAISSYIISYKYDSDKYFYLGSEPECYYSNNADGIVIFKQREPSDATLDYSVELHEYLDVSLVADMERDVTINEAKYKGVKANSKINIPKLRYGQHVKIITNKEWDDLENCRELILVSSGRESENYTYDMIVPEKDGEFLFDPSEYRYEHGTISFKCFGKTVASPQVLAKGSKIYYSQNTADEGYWLAPGDNFIIVGEEQETKQQLQDIHFTQMVQVKVALEQPERGGKVIYSVDGNRLYGSTYSTYSGTVIEMEFVPWEGWILNSNAHSGDTYVVKDSESQIVGGDEYEISSVFTEDRKHMPEMTVTLEKTVGKDMEFSISASGFNSDKLSYGGGWKFSDVFNKDASKYNAGNSQEIITQQKIGTGSPIYMTIGNSALPSGQAVRLVITKTDSNDNKESETRYITNMTKRLEPIYIYKPEEVDTSKIWYKSINITIGIVDINEFNMLSPSANSIISVRNMLTNEMMSDGELIEGTEKVTVTINPEDGYYITGKKVTEGVYQDTMKYSDYLKNIADIIVKHPAAKFYTITLDANDPFATYSYNLDGEEVGGTITVKEGQKLTLIYNITDSAHKLEKNGIPVPGWGKSYTKAKKELTITPDMDGNTITKDDFGIKVKGGIKDE